MDSFKAGGFYPGGGDDAEFARYAQAGAQMEQMANARSQMDSPPLPSPVDLTEKAHLGARLLGKEDVIMDPRIAKKLAGYADKHQRIQEAKQRYLEDPDGYVLETANDIDGLIAAQMRDVHGAPPNTPSPPGDEPEAVDNPQEEQSEPGGYYDSSAPSPSYSNQGGERYTQPAVRQGRGGTQPVAPVKITIKKSSGVMTGPTREQAGRGGGDLEASRQRNMARYNNGVVASGAAQGAMGGRSPSQQASIEDKILSFGDKIPIALKNAAWAATNEGVPATYDKDGNIAAMEIPEGGPTDWMRKHPNLTNAGLTALTLLAAYKGGKAVGRRMGRGASSTGNVNLNSPGSTVKLNRPMTQAAPTQKLHSPSAAPAPKPNFPNPPARTTPPAPRTVATPSNPANAPAQKPMGSWRQQGTAAASNPPAGPQQGAKTQPLVDTSFPTLHQNWSDRAPGDMSTRILPGAKETQKLPQPAQAPVLALPAGDKTKKLAPLPAKATPKSTGTQVDPRVQKQIDNNTGRAFDDPKTRAAMRTPDKPLPSGANTQKLPQEKGANTQKLPQEKGANTQKLRAPKPDSAQRQKLLEKIAAKQADAGVKPLRWADDSGPLGKEIKTGGKEKPLVIPTQVNKNNFTKTGQPKPPPDPNKKTRKPRTPNPDAKPRKKKGT